MKSLYEGLLDNNLFNDIDKTISTEWLKQNVKSQYKLIQLKNGQLKIWGKLVIKGVDQIGWLNINTLEGDLYVENCGIVDLSNIFAEYAKVKGNIHITGCKNLTDVSALPHYVDGDVTISNCPALKDLSNVNCLAGEVQIMRCGKRFKEGAIKIAFPAAVKIFCSEEDIEANLNEAFVNEAFQDPVLIRLYDQIRNLRKKFRITDMFGGYSKLDQISPSDRETYKFPSDEKKILTAARKICANTNSLNGFIATEDWDGNFVFLINNTQDAFWLKEGGFPGNWSGDDFDRVGNVNDLLNMLKPSSTKMNNVKFVHIWFPASDRWSDVVDRRKAREGMIDPRNPEELRKIKREQLDRYKKAIAAIKAKRGSEGYKKVVTQVEALMARFTKFMNKMITDPKWGAANQWKANDIFDSFRKGYVRGASSQRYGVIYAFQQWASHIVRAINQEKAYGDGTGEAEQLKNAMEWADRALTTVGM